MPDPHVSQRLRRYVRVAYAPEAVLHEQTGRDDDVGQERAVRAGTRARAGSRTRWRARWGTRPGVAVRAGAVVLLAGALAAAWVMLRPAPDGPAVPLVDPGPTAVAAPTAAGPTAAGPTAPGPAASGPSGDDAGVPVVVHVAGAVVRPGVVELPAGARVLEAIEAAGGSAPDADLDTLNLAAPLVDGQQVYVPAQGEEAGAGAAGGSAAPAPGSGSGGSGGTGGAVAVGPVDLNVADAAALDTLPGIGPALADRILEHRELNGPFTSVEQLTDVSGIGPATMDRLRDLVTV